jgi:Uncharacterized conserved domain (SAYSvFN)
MPPRGFSKSRALWENAAAHRRYLMRALLYELQPLRYAALRTQARQGVRWCRQVGGDVLFGLRTWMPSLVRGSVATLGRVTWPQWHALAGLALYGYFIRWMHEAFDAGPLVLIITLLVIIFTVGLSDAPRDGFSAYSVFNKGFQKLLGSVDADALLQQHLGGGWIPPVDREVAPPWRRPPQDPPPRIIEAEEALPPDAPVPRARRTGKKARRDRVALEQRREIRAQREAALALGDNDAAVLERLLQNEER